MAPSPWWGCREAGREEGARWIACTWLCWSPLWLRPAPPQLAGWLAGREEGLWPLASTRPCIHTPSKFMLLQDLTFASKHPHPALPMPDSKQMLWVSVNITLIFQHAPICLKPLASMVNSLHIFMYKGEILVTLHQAMKKTYLFQGIRLFVSLQSNLNCTTIMLIIMHKNVYSMWSNTSYQRFKLALHDWVQLVVYKQCSWTLEAYFVKQRLFPYSPVNMAKHILYYASPTISSNPLRNTHFVYLGNDQTESFWHCLQSIG